MTIECETCGTVFNKYQLSVEKETGISIPHCPNCRTTVTKGKFKIITEEKHSTDT